MTAQLSFVQRWRERRDRWRPVGEIIQPSEYAVDGLGFARARSFVETHHYSGTVGATRLSVGLYRGRQLAGVAVFSVPMQQKSIPKRTGVRAEHGVELGRFVLLDEVPANGETWFLARAFKLLRAELPEVRAVVSYSDPVRRTALDGTVTLIGHVGTIYQSHNGRFVGRSSSRTMWLGPTGHEIPPRAISKIRNREVGADGAYRRLVAMGAPERQRGEDWRAYIERVRACGAFRGVRHPGNLCYVWGFERDVRRGLPESLPYPKHDAIVHCDRRAA